MSWFRVPPEAAHEKVTALGVLCCFALFVCLTMPASFFLPSHLSLVYIIIHVQYYTYYMYEGISDRVSGIAYLGFWNAYLNYVSNHLRLVMFYSGLFVREGDSDCAGGDY